MAELAQETNHPEIEVVEEEQEMMEEDGDCSASMEPNSTFPAELNLLIMVLSLFSLSPEEDCLNCEERQMMKSAKEQDAKAGPPKLHTKKQGTHEAKIAGRRSQRFLQPMIKDCRHGRKM